ncbi:alpha/beta hydrolase [Nocardia zapadnayensis]|uniref:alpha/beta fold hydrolase n=1 Tax=Nocardia rhamnosiphila TaxID=426716 RepID=UPI002247F1F7|nr:alpha/beta hydrolase [Nocardia zapadnayensis]MCX0273382.1 alpha/beta hydrolase [Nocardia zapadnayensis]
MFTYSGHDGHPLRAEARGAGATVVLLHGGGPDHRSLLPLADRLADTYRVVLPDIRGYGQSPCPDPAAHTWSCYAEDVTALLDHLGAERASIGGMGLGSTITARAATAHPERFDAAILISLEDIEDDAAKQAEAALLDAFAETVTARGVDAAWAPILPGLAPVIGTLVREAIPRSDPASIAAAAAIGRDRAFRTPADLTALTAPTLVIPGVDHRHPTRFAEEVAGLLPNGRLERDVFPDRIDTADDLAAALAPSIRQFLADAVGR